MTKQQTTFTFTTQYNTTAQNVLIDIKC